MVKLINKYVMKLTGQMLTDAEDKVRLKSDKIWSLTVKMDVGSLFGKQQATVALSTFVL